MSPLLARRSSLEPPTRVEFHLEEFDRMIEQHGYDAIWSKNMPCPNNDPTQPQHHRLDCEFCDLSRRIYFDPQPIRVHVASFSTRQTFQTEGRYEPGTAYFTTKPVNKLYFWDKLELTSAVARFSEVKQRQKDNIYELKYAALELVHIRTSQNVVIDPTTATLDVEGNVIMPAWAGNFLSFVYTYHPVYILLDLMHHMRSSRIVRHGVDTEVEFPVQAMGRLDFLVRDESGEPQ